MKKLKKAMNIALIGMPGAYKTTVARLLAPKIGYMSFDSDAYVEFERGQTISEIVDKYGIDIFRYLESSCIHNAVTYKKAVISTGGGVILNPENIKLLAKNCLIVYLYATPATLYKRISKQNNRPLIQPNTLSTVEELYKKRSTLYESCADITINTNKLTSLVVTERILSKLTEIDFIY